MTKCIFLQFLMKTIWTMQGTLVYGNFFKYFTWSYRLKTVTCLSEIFGGKPGGDKRLLLAMAAKYMATKVHGK